MTVQEAIQLMKSRVETATELMGKGIDGKAYEDMEMAIEALEELEQYRALGTVEELKEARGKQPKTDWIPCEERLPENLEQVLVWYEYFRYGDYNCMYQTYGIGYHLDGFWSGDVSGHQARCIAWQPLPAPYKKEGVE